MSGFPWEETIFPVETIVREMVHNYNDWSTSIIEPMSSGQILCVHHIQVEQTDENKYLTRTEWHILEPGQRCLAEGSNEQYTRR